MLGPQENQRCKFQSKEKTDVPDQAVSMEELSLTQLFVLFRFLTDCMRATHIREYSLLYSVYPFKY